MNHKLDDELSSLRAEPPSAAFGQIEPRVWRSIESARRARAAAPALYVARAAAVAGALGLGIASGGATADAVAGQPQEISAFSVRAQLAPSTLLDHHE